MADIYGTQNSLLSENGLAHAENKEDFSVKLAGLQAVWDNIAPGFHYWFKKRRSDIFIECLVLSSRERHGISKRFTTNGLELKHRLQKKVLTEDEVQIVSISQSLKKWIETYFKEARRAVRGIGKYRLSPEFSSFYVDPAI